MPETTSPKVEMTCLQGLADLEGIEGPWLNGMATSEPEITATVRLLLAHMTWTSKRLLGAMVLDRVEVELAISRLGADVCHPGFDNSHFCQPACQRTDESA